MTERINLNVPMAEQTSIVKYMIGRSNRPVTYYLCCPHCEPCSMKMRHETPCSWVTVGDGVQRKSCIVGQMPV